MSSTDYHHAGGLEFGDGNVKVDPSVSAKLPLGCRIVSIKAHGSSFWANTGRIDIKLTDGNSKSFFIKVTSQEVGKNMVRSEFECTMAIHTLLSNFTPKPITWGTYQTNTDTHFYLCEFREMIEKMPDPYEFTKQLATLRQNSKCPEEGKFGFHIPTYRGNLPQLAGWESSWETYFTKSLKLDLAFELEAKGPDAELNTLLPVLFEKVIPRLLRPLESEGRTVKPCLVHGDLWYANSGIDVETGACLVFDACSFYAHNEYEFGQWRPVCNRFGKEYLDAYHSYVQVSPPEEDYEGRLDLYKLCVGIGTIMEMELTLVRKFNTRVSALFRDDRTLREQ
ncbi:MAG: hypothetical protein Q9222_004496 [Ikaeria aurantiellina]